VKLRDDDYAQDHELTRLQQHRQSYRKLRGYAKRGRLRHQDRNRTHTGEQNSPGKEASARK
jgi:hypothetical protein